MQLSLVVHSIRKHIVPYYVSLKEYFFYELPARFLHVYPDTINFPITSKCNSSCVMCNVWKMEEKDLDSQEIGLILKDSLFRKVKSVGISGGEPTMREDLFECVQQIISNLRNLRILSLISNGIDTEKLLNICRRIHPLCIKNSVFFGVTVSLDGVGEIHNISRGTNVFNTVDRTIRLLAQEKCYDAFSVGTTITKYNVDHLGKVLEYCDSLSIPVFFQVATEHERLHNIGNSLKFSITKKQESEVCIFLSGLLNRYKRWSSARAKIENLLGILGEGKERSIKCLMQARGVTLSGDGSLSYCAVRSRILGNAARESARKIYFAQGNLSYRKSILRKYCLSCFHNYTGRIPLSTLVKKTGESLLSRFFPVLSLFTLLCARFSSLIPERKKVNIEKVFITGWYGTETIGDKAILIGIINMYRGKYPSVRFIIHSIRPYFTKLTLIEENLSDIVSIVPDRMNEIKKAIKTCDTVLIGGGPLFQTPRLAKLLRILISARLLNKRTIVFGCGIGPIRKPLYTRIAKRICETAGTVILRDDNSLTLLRRAGYKKKTYILHDPAAFTSLEYYQMSRIEKDSNTILFALRQWPESCAGDLSNNSFHDLQKKLDNQLVGLLSELVRYGKKPILLPMHTFHHGGDDRLYYRHILKKMDDPSGIRLIDKRLSVAEVIDLFKSCGFAVCMRYHSIVFAATLGVPFIGIDYSSHGNTGKGAAFMKSTVPGVDCFSVEDIAEMDEDALIKSILSGVGKQHSFFRPLVVDLDTHRRQYNKLI